MGRRRHGAGAEEEWPWDVLHVSETASLEELKKAYRVRVKALHPDSGGRRDGASEQMAAVSRAYKALTVPAEREYWDRERRRRLAARATTGGALHQHGRSAGFAALRFARRFPRVQYFAKAMLRPPNLVLSAFIVWACFYANAPQPAAQPKSQPQPQPQPQQKSAMPTTPVAARDAPS